jgi:hypothetical protein
MRRIAALVLLISWLGSGRAHAYVRYKTVDQNMPFYWRASCVPVTVYTNGFTQMTSDEVAKAVSAAAHTWSPDDVTCADGVTHPFLEIVPTLSVGGGAAPAAKYDARNVIIFQNDTWDHQGDALALTTVLAKGDGRIVDADIEINATAGLQWVNLDPGSNVLTGHGVDAQDLQNALTHEFGHFIGLDHTCYSPDGPDQSMTIGRPKDYLGNPVPDCTDAPPAVRATVMYPSTNLLETSKRYLSPDDVLAVCDIYAPANDPKICAMDTPNDGLGCTTAGGAARGGPLAALAALAGGALLFRRRRTRP